MAIAFRSEEELDALLRELETYFAAQRFSNNAAAFEAVKSYALQAGVGTGSKTVMKDE